MGTIAIKGRHRSELPVEELSEKPPGVVEPVGKLAGRTTGLLCRERLGGLLKSCYRDAANGSDETWNP